MNDTDYPRPPAISSQDDYDDMAGDILAERDSGIHPVMRGPAPAGIQTGIAAAILGEDDARVEAARARMNAAWKWPERSSWVDIQRMLPDLQHAAERAGWIPPYQSTLQLKTPARPNVAACITWTDAPIANVPGGSALADTAAASRLILIGRIQAYESLGDMIEDGYTSHTNVTPIRRNPR